MIETRVPAGVPTGGQFAAHRRGEAADVALCEPQPTTEEAPLLTGPGDPNVADFRDPDYRLGEPPQEDVGIYPCPACKGFGVQRLISWAPPCAYCDSTGKVDADAAAKYTAADAVDINDLSGYAPGYTYSDTSREPDFEAIRDARNEEAYYRRGGGADREYGGIDW